MLTEHDHAGIHCLIEPGVILEVENLLKTFDPKLIVEFGTYYGGFTRYLAEWFKSIPIYSIDIKWYLQEEVFKWFMERKNINLILTANLFNKEFLVNVLLALPIRKFLFIDNGDKDVEMMLYGSNLNPGDLMGIHDWSTEVKLEKCGHILKEFNEHTINKKFSEPGYSQLRFFIRKNHFQNEGL